MAYTVPMPPSQQEVNEEQHRKHVQKAKEDYRRTNRPKPRPKPAY